MSWPRRCRPARCWAGATTRTNALFVVVAGAVFGAMLVALLAPVGSRSGVPSMIAARAPLGLRRAGGGGAALPHQLRVDCREQHDRRLGVRAGSRGGRGRARSGRPRSAWRPRRSSREDRARSARRSHRGADDGGRRRGAHLVRVLTSRSAATPPRRRTGARHAVGPRRRHRLPGVVAADVRRLLPLYEVGPQAGHGGVCRTSRCPRCG